MASEPAPPGPGPVAWLLPGQGSQVVGMARELCAAFPPAAAALRLAGEHAGMDLAQLVAHGPDDALTRTDRLQPALTAVTIGCCLFLEEAGLRPGLVAGHSLGEYAALFAAGVLTLEDAIALVAERGRVMHEAALALDGGMISASGLDGDTLHGVLAALPATGAYPVAAANLNAPRQVAVCGPRAALPAAVAAIVAAGGQAVPLNVSGPWHSAALEPAAARFAARLDATTFHEPRVPVAMNTTGALATDAATIRAAMRAQLASPVRWHAAMLSLHAAGATRFVEPGPRKVLRGLLRHIPELERAEAANFDAPRALPFVRRLYGEAA